ncbi:MAG: 4Fe-4S binding protein [Bacteroidetes bacterium]|nr:4Fe-4S binding protein [Bacteroidota bacterium]
MKNNFLTKIFKSKYFLIVMQLITITAFTLLIIGSIGVDTGNNFKITKIIQHTNLPNLLVWSYWFSLIIIVAIIFGRFWCSVCPMELIISIFNRLGLKKKPGKFMKSGWLVTILYTIILIFGIHVFLIQWLPMRMALYMLSLLSIVIIVSLIWEKRTFCNYVCPIGFLLKLYSLFSTIRIKNKSKEVCKNCKTRDCISKKNHYNFIKRSCTSNVNPPDLKYQNDCILCGQCIKTCPNDNLKIGYSKPSLKKIANINFSSSEISFIVIIAGLVLWEILFKWEVARGFYLAPLYFISNLFGFADNFFKIIKALFFFIIYPSFLFLIFSLIMKYFSKKSLKDCLGNIVISILPIIIIMHLLSAILIMIEHSVYIPLAISDPIGFDTATAILNKTILVNRTEYIPWLVTLLCITLPIIGFIISYKIIKLRKNNKAQKTIALLTSFVYFALFEFSLIGWRFDLIEPFLKTCN